MLGGLTSSSVRQFQDTEAQCGGSNEQFGLAQAIIFAVEKINNDPYLLPNISLGYDIRNYDGNITKAGKITYELFEDTLCANSAAGNKTKRKPIVALIGPFDSRTALYIGGILRMFNVSGISGTTTSGELSSNSYAHLYRTVPSDTFLAKAMVDIIEHFNWSYVAAVGLDDSYGRGGVWSLVNEATARKHPFCIAMTEFIRHEAQFPSIKYVVEELKSRQNIKVVILWDYLQRFIEEVSRQNLTDRVWILSEIYSISKENDFMDSRFSVLEGSIGFQHHDYNGHEFKESLKTILTNAMTDNMTSEWSDVEDNPWNCPGFRQVYDSSKSEQHHSNVVNEIYSSYVPYIIDAVYSAAHALDILTTDLNGIDASDLQQFDVNIKKMQKVLGRVNFTGLTGKIKFDKFGDIDSASYDIFSIERVSSETNGLKTTLVGKWENHAKSKAQLNFYREILWRTVNGETPKSECSEQCQPGTRKSSTSPCCWHCVQCPGGSVNPYPGSASCVECPKGRTANQAKTECVALPSANLSYTSVGGMFILGFATLGLLLSAVFAFNVRKIPETFSEAKRTAFSLYIFLLSLLCFHPVEWSIDGWYVTVVDCVTTLLSAYGFLGCIFLPKMYILLFRPDLNVLANIRQEVTQFSFGSNRVRVRPAVDISTQEPNVRQK
ncbi:hypothetical protein pdam_00016226 [Pocillopora damicornis]|uniref:G-protein coupled receptors family 3 profile domain-containing protein n=1 Tax=Pocillopora damicornis TaxID=46731 RepID=A0A3M6U0H7_POCDA|nr:hypothetical protein pdam_00016226 [Pocillopora damicornis]